jgi:hypothetical protein
VPIEFQYDQKANLLKCIASGSLTIDEIIRYFDTLMQQDLQPGCIEFVDMTNLMVMYIGYHDNKRLTRAYAGLTSRGLLGSVLLAPNKLTRSICDALVPVFRQAGLTLVVVTARDQVDKAIAELRAKRTD